MFICSYISCQILNDIANEAIKISNSGRMAESKNFNICYNVFESSEGSIPDLTPVIFLHGMLCSKEMWDNIPQAIADETKRKIYVCDARNHGENDHTDVFNFDLTVEDLFNFMDRKDIPKAILVGHSMGGMTSIIASIKKPERVEMIFSVDVFIKKIPKEMTEKLTQFTTLFANTVRNIPKETPESEVVKTVVTRLYENFPEDSDFQKEKESMMKSKYIFKRKPDGGYDVSFNEDAILKFAKDADQYECVPDGQFKGPAYFLYGTKSDVQVSKEETNIKMHFPEAKLIAFEGATHSLHIDFPDKFIKTLLDYL